MKKMSYIMVIVVSNAATPDFRESRSCSCSRSASDRAVSPRFVVVLCSYNYINTNSFQRNKQPSTRRQRRSKRALHRSTRTSSRFKRRSSIRTCLPTIRFTPSDPTTPSSNLVVSEQKKKKKKKKVKKVRRGERVSGVDELVRKELMNVQLFIIYHDDCSLRTR